MPDTSSTKSSYSKGGLILSSSRYAYTVGGTGSSQTKSGFMSGNGSLIGSCHAYISAGGGSVSSRKFAYIGGINRSSIHAYIGALIMSTDYIWLKTSDAGVTKSKKFKVLAQDYDDGTGDKAENLDRTIGGGIDHSVGAIYTTWSPVIQLRETEEEADFGNIYDLEYFYNLNNPNGVPSNDITFIDHHQNSYVVHIIGRMEKSILSTQIQGTDAWYLYKLSLVKVQ